jgi:ferredoxin
LALSRDKSELVIFDETTGFEIEPDLCTGCGLCMLSCTHVKKREFSFAGAYIKIERDATLESFVPEFTEDCDSCGVCINYCGYEAIRKPGESRSWFVRAPERAAKLREKSAKPGSE